jgi:hypothetical protein
MEMKIIKNKKRKILNSKKQPRLYKESSEPRIQVLRQIKINPKSINPKRLRINL